MVGPHGFEFCRINYENFNGREHRYIWGNGFGTMIPDKIMKVDTHTKEWKIWKEEVKLQPITRIPTVKLKIPGKSMRKAGYQTSVTFKL